MNAEKLKRLRDPANVLTRLDDKLKTISADPLIVASGKRIDELERELAKWQAIAINERARVLYFAHAGDDMYDMGVLEESDHFKKRHLPQAAKELDLQISQEANQIRDLEKKNDNAYWMFREERETIKQLFQSGRIDYVNLSVAREKA